ncbi:DNA ligase 3 [Armadillidium nasatum]|uniref:DNA ligase n=1 Tax=Armadillidium nasatum TaxID=96803 RepID=A0A5N5TDR3_9CRUS|nr:DNA ligase 3 [Armadillidium nasatum]
MILNNIEIVEDRTCAQACRSVEQAMEKCPNGIYAEIKYDGERVQVHKKGTEFKYFSRSLKPVMPHKVSHFKDYIPSAFPHGSDLILDSEILLIDTNTSLPLPFGTLGKHKKGEIQDANVCLFVFDCIHYNGVNLLDRPIKERRKILEKNMVVVKNHVVLSEMKEIHKPEELRKMIQSVIKQGLEGLVLKDINSIYEPGKRHWLKVKKDYLQDGAMADSADLVVLGAFYGTGKKVVLLILFKGEKFFGVSFINQK